MAIIFPAFDVGPLGGLGYQRSDKNKKVQQHFIRPSTSIGRPIKRLATAVPCRSFSGRHSRSRRLSDDVVRDVMWRNNPLATCSDESRCPSL